MDEAARLLQHGALALRAGAVDDALAALERAVELEPGRRHAFLLLGLAHERRGDLDLARAAYSEAGEEPSDAQRRQFGEDPPPPLPAGVGAVPAGAAALALALGNDGLLLAPAGIGCCARLRRPVLMSGDVRFEAAGRRRRGLATEEPIEGEGGALYRLVGEGAMLLAPGGGRFTHVPLAGHVLYAREDCLEAFDGTLLYESGRLPGREVRIPAARLSGHGGVVLHTRRALVAFPVAPERRVQAVPESVIGWYGAVVPYLAPGVDGQPAALLCDGRGVLLIEPPGDEAA